MKNCAMFSENGLNSFPTEINRNLSLSPEEARLSHLLASVSAHNNTVTEQLEKKIRVTGEQNKE